MTEYVNYPQALPRPEVSRRQLKPRAPYSDLPGRYSFDRLSADYVSTAELQFFFSAEQAEVFHAWWKDNLRQGGYCFNCAWPNLFSGQMVCQFITEPTFTHAGFGAYRVSVTAQVRGASLPVQALVPFEGDLFWQAVMLELSDPGEVGTSNVVDGSSYQRAPTAVENTFISDDDPPPGLGSFLRWSGSGTGRVAFDSSLDFGAVYSGYISFWLRIVQDAAGTSNLLSSSFTVTMNTTQLVFGGSGGLAAGTRVRPLVGRWAHIGVTCDGTLRRYFVNGLLVDAATVSLGLAISAAGFELYTAHNGRQYDIAGLRYYSGAGRPFADKVFPISPRPKQQAPGNRSPHMIQRNPGATGVTITAPTPVTHRVEASALAASNYHQAFFKSSRYGKRYIEFVVEGAGDSLTSVGRGSLVGLTNAVIDRLIPSNPLNSYSFLVANWNYGGGSPGYVLNGNSFVSNSTFDFLQGDVLCFAYDFATGRLWYRKNSAPWIGGGDPATDTSPTATLVVKQVVPYISHYLRGSGAPGDWQVRAVFDPAEFSQALPAGFEAFAEAHTGGPVEGLVLLGDTLNDLSPERNNVYLTQDAEITDAQTWVGEKSFYIPNTTGVASRIVVTFLRDPLGGAEGWTFECRIRRSVTTATSVLFSALGFSSTITSAGQIFVSLTTSAGSTGSQATGIFLPADTWVKLAIELTSSQLVVYLNGAPTFAVARPNGGFTDTPTTLQRAWTIGQNLAGYIQQIRVTVQGFRYGAAYTPTLEPLPYTQVEAPVTEAGPPWDQTVLLLHMDGDTWDASKYANAVTVGAVEWLSVIAPKFGKSCVAFNLNRLQFAHSTLFAMGTQDFTIRLWMRPDPGGPSGLLIAKRNNISTFGPFRVTYLSTKQVQFSYSVTGTNEVVGQSAADSVLEGEWNHVAFVRQGSSFLGFLNGQLVATLATSASALVANTHALNIGREGDNNNPYRGEMQELEVIRGTAVWTSNFSVPAAPRRNG